MSAVISEMHPRQRAVRVMVVAVMVL